MKIDDEIHDKITEIAERYYSEDANCLGDLIAAMTELIRELPNVTHEPCGG